MTGWDDGIVWSATRTEDPDDVPVSVDYVRDQVLRVANGSIDDEYIEHQIKAVTAVCERWTQQALRPQTWQQMMSGFPCGAIVVQRHPLLSVQSLEYYDSDDALRTLDGSPLQYRVVRAGESRKAELWPLVNETWPSTSCRVDAVTVTYRAGYEDTSVSPTVYPIPEDLITGICLMVAELYNKRGLSITTLGASTVPTVLQPERFWPRVF